MVTQPTSNIAFLSSFLLFLLHLKWNAISTTNVTFALININHIAFIIISAPTSLLTGLISFFCNLLHFASFCNFLDMLLHNISCYACLISISLLHVSLLLWSYSHTMNQQDASYCCALMNNAPSSQVLMSMIEVHFSKRACFWNRQQRQAVATPPQ